MEKALFEYKISNGDEKPAIWFKLHGREVKVYPFGLFRIFWDCSGELYICNEVKAKIQILRDEVCGYYHDDTCGYYYEEYPRELYVNSAIDSLQKLCEAVIRGGKSDYRSFELNAAKQMLAGLKSLIIPKNYCPLSKDEITIERFSFDFIDPYSCDTDYIMRIGNRVYRSALSDWTTDFDAIRLEIENYVLTYCYKDIELYFEDSPTILRLRKNSKDKKEIVNVTIFPNSFIHEPIVFGWCDSRQLISALYIGLLGLCIWETDWFENDWTGEWKDFRLATYNKLQSCVIENYIKGIPKDDYKYYPRQRVVDSVEAMKEDYRIIKEEFRII